MKFSEKAMKFFKEASEKVKKFAKEVFADKKKFTAAIAIILVVAIGLPLTLILTLGGPKKLSAPLNVAVNAETKTVTWDAVKNASNYVVSIGLLAPSDDETYISENKTPVNGTTYSLSALTDAGTYKIKVTAKGDGKKFTDSDWSGAMEYTVSENSGGDPDDPTDPNEPNDPDEPGGNDDAPQLPAPQVTLNSNKILTWSAVSNATKYTVSIDGKETSVGNITSYPMPFLPTGTYQIKVKAIGSGTTYLNSEWSNIESYTAIEELSFRLISGSEYYVDGIGTVTSGDIVVPSSHRGLPVTQIYYKSFFNKTSIKTVVIPNSVTKIGNEAFSSCYALETVETLGGVTDIGSSAFKDCYKLTDIEIPSSVKTIRTSAFQNCVSLTEIVIPNGVTSVGLGAFNGCSKLESITIPFTGGYPGAQENTSVFGYIFGASNWNQNSSYVPASLKTVVITGGDYIWSRTFYGCSNLTSIEIPNSVKTIGGAAFENCSGLTNIEIPSGVTEIGGSAFKGCDKLESITIPFVGWRLNGLSGSYLVHFGYIFGMQYTNADHHLVPASLKTVIITGSEYIPTNAFYNKSNLTTIEIPDSVKYIREDAFYGCGSLVNVEIPSGVTTLDAGAFNGCSSLTNITIPVGIDKIEDRMFENCASLTSIVIPNNIKTIGIEAFLYSGIWNNTPENSVVYADKWAVGYNGDREELVSLTFNPDTVGISYKAFELYDDLTNIVIPESVKYIGAFAFEYCPGLTSVTIGRSAPNITAVGYRAFNGCNSSLIVYVPAGSADAYKAAAYWDDYADKITETEE
jgi:hypothetical protein